MSNKEYENPEKVPYTKAQIDRDPIALASYFVKVTSSTQQLRDLIDQAQEKATEIQKEASDITALVKEEQNKLDASFSLC